MPTPPRLSLKIDVDTEIGTRVGIPALLAMLRDLRITASFFLVMGPDNTGKAIRRVFTRRGFVGKMARTNPVKIYGLKQLLYGTLLPAPPTGSAHPEILRRIRDEGHEVALHAWDHVEWQDRLFDWGPERVADEYGKGCRSFEQVFGYPPRASGTPGWQASAESLALLDVTGVMYASDSRGTHPFYPAIGDRVFRTLQVPGTLPTVDELLGLDGRDEAAVIAELEAAVEREPGSLFSRISAKAEMRENNEPGSLHVYTAHAEVEGMSLAGPFRRLLERLVSRGVTFHRLEEIAAEHAGRAPVCQLAQGLLPGRAGTLAVQGRNLGPLPAGTAPGKLAP